MSARQTLVSQGQDRQKGTSRGELRFCRLISLFVTRSWLEGDMRFRLLYRHQDQVDRLALDRTAEGIDAMSLKGSRVGKGE
jgi:hypothetical protein